MAVIILDSLLLRGCVRLDVVAVEALGASKVDAQAPGNRTSMRHPLPGGSLTDPMPGFAGRERYATSGMTPGAGRSRFPWRKRPC